MYNSSGSRPNPGIISTPHISALQPHPEHPLDGGLILLKSGQLSAKETVKVLSLFRGDPPDG